MKKQPLPSIGVALLCSVTFFLFGPLEILLSSAQDFWFRTSDVLVHILVSTAICFAVIFCVLFAAARIKRQKVFSLLAGLFGGLGTALYVQGNWTFVKYGLMDGTPIDWSNFGIWPIIDLLLWAVLVIGITLIFCLRPKWQSALTAGFFAIVGIEIITLTILGITGTGFKKGNDFSLTNSGELKLSKTNDNVLVVLADGFDGEDLLPVFEEEPSFRDSFDGYTFYEDTCGTSLYSEESLATILTGNQLEVGPTFKENIRQAYANTELYDILRDNNYKTYLFSSEEMVDSTVAETLENYSAQSSGLADFGQVFSAIYKMVAFRYMPHQLKPLFWYTTMDFNSLKAGESYSWSNFKFYDLIQTQGIAEETEDCNVYQYIYIQGPHEPVVMDRYVQPLAEKIKMDSADYHAGQFEQEIGVVRMFTVLNQKLKDAGVYDNTTVILLADHGWDNRRNPLLMIKPQNSRGELQISGIPVSMIEDYMPTLLYFVTGSKEYGKTIYDHTKEEPRARPFYVYTFAETINDRTYSDMTVEKVYQKNKCLTLGEEWGVPEMIGYAKSGLSGNEKWGVWTLGNAAIWKLRVPDVENDILLEIGYCRAYADAQTVEVDVNGHIIERFVANGAEEKQILIPKEYFDGDQLLLTLHLPDAVSPKAMGESEDTRELALALTRMKFSAVSAD